MKPVWCVKWKQYADALAKSDVNDSTGWCATFRGNKPSAKADSDKTACGMFVTLRIGEALRQPTCSDCRKAIARRRENKKDRR